jgi:DNA mismatch repair protein MutL
LKNIHLLDNSLINKIAAGEVVERPASVVKELAENSMDAGADKITIEIKDGGTKLIKITDNGSGIPENQVKLAFERHATSKIASFDDLSSVLTFGFRGEALASVSSVSQTEIFTRTQQQEVGVHLQIDAGVISKEENIALNKGTIISVSNLFYNTPVRRKFLKKPSTESAYISETIDHLALGNPHISFTYINNGNEVLRTNGDGNLKNAMFYIYGRDTASKMLEVKKSKNGFTIKGLVGKPQLSRANRSHGLFFINGRFIKSDVVKNAVEDAYKGKMMVGKFPVYALDLTVPADTVDVNVHPAKLEVRFSNEDFIYDFIKSAVEETFKNEILIPDVSFENKSLEETTGKRAYKAEFQRTLEEFLLSDDNDDEEPLLEVETDKKLYVSEPVENEKDTEVHSKAKFSREQFINVSEILSDFEKEDISEIKTESHMTDNSVENTDEIKCEDIQRKKAESDKACEKKSFFRNYKIVGQIFSTYWIIEMNNNMYLIDQHAAHERVLYEEFTKKIKNGAVASQQLLKPVSTKVDAVQERAIKDNMELFEKFGFEIEEFGDLTYVIRAVPYVFENPSSPDFFIEIADMLSQGKKLNGIYDTREDAIATMSCKAAVKGNNKLSYMEAKTLIEKMMQIENPFSCPHGRPTIVEISKYKIEKLFKRIQD